MAKTRKISTQTLALGAMLTALVIVLQLLGSFIRFGMFSISLVLIPIVVGAAMCGPAISAWLGLVFGIAVLLSGDASAFLAVSVPGTILTVLAKGVLCGLAAGFTYRWLSGKNIYLGVFAAAIVCPLVNTGVFLLGCLVFFLPTITAWAGGNDQTLWQYILFGLVGGNFLFELGFNLVLSPIIVRLLRISKRLR